MSVQSKYFQVTSQILMEYKTDQYKITSLKSAVGEDKTNYYMYQGNDGRQYCLETQNIPHSKYVKNDKSTYYYGGKGVTEIEIDKSTDYVFGGKMYLPEDILLGTTIRDADGYVEREDYINHDTIRLYILTGYVMNNIAGYSLRVSGKVNKVIYDDGESTLVKRIDTELVLLDWYLPKDELKDNIHWMKNPLYLNSKFYDRYIEIKLPSAYDAALNKRNIDYVYEHIDDDGKSIIMRGYMDQYAGIYIDFSTVQPDNVTVTSGVANNPQTFILDVPKTSYIQPKSNSNNFNVRLFENNITHTIEYYPVYGDTDNTRDLSYSIMSAIETGAIPMLDLADIDDANNGMDEFLDMYGDGVYKWIIINELTVTYNYEKITQNIYEKLDELSYTEYYTNTIDYSNKKDDTSEFWKSKFIPYIQERTGYTCKSVVLSYTCHLFNRLNNIEIVRAASMVVNDPYKYTLTSINTSNVVKYKIVNKISSDTNTISNNVSTGQQTAYIREYYDITNITIKDTLTNNTYTQGKMTLKLKRAGSNYMVKLFIRDSDNILTPYDLSGPYNYKMIFPSTSSSVIEIFPNSDSASGTNLILGQLTFYISADKAQSIMSVPASERYFALTTHYPGLSQKETSLYEGKVEWYV